MKVIGSHSGVSAVSLSVDVHLICGVKYNERQLTVVEIEVRCRLQSGLATIVEITAKKG